MAKLYETITAENWRKGVMWRDGRGCILAHAVRLGIGLDCEVYAAIYALFPDRGGSIGRFNDHPDTTLDDVLRVCKLADV